jgi:hypothetical protein
MSVIILGCLTALLVISLLMVCVQCIKIEKSVLDLTDIVEERVLKMYEVKK